MDYTRPERRIRGRPDDFRLTWQRWDSCSATEYGQTVNKCRLVEELLGTRTSDEVDGETEISLKILTIFGRRESW